jgi:hypothetical protein
MFPKKINISEVLRLLPALARQLLLNKYNHHVTACQCALSQAYAFLPPPHFLLKSRNRVVATARSA